MSFFDTLVDEALRQQTDYAPLRVVVEKELLHHDILRIMSETGLLNSLTFIGGTCLRTCYGGERLSEDLDFTGGQDFYRDAFSTLASAITESLAAKYGLPVEVSEPVRETGDVDTWKVRIQTRPERPDLPSQRINIDICAVNSYERQPRLIRNHYGIEFGTSGLILQAESLNEILVDKVLAFALRPNRLKNRDLWDIGWLVRKNAMARADFLASKLDERRIPGSDFRQLFESRLATLTDDSAMKTAFLAELQRFLPNAVIKQTIGTDLYWPWLVQTIGETWAEFKKVL